MPHPSETDLLNAVAIAAALVAEADGRIERAERERLADYLVRSGFLAGFSRTEIVDAFERRVELLAERGGYQTAVEALGRFSGSSDPVIEAGEAVAVADNHLHDRERHVLEIIRAALGVPRATPHRDRVW